MYTWNADNFKKLCKASNLTADQLVEALDISEAALIKYKRGQLPRTENLIKIADFFAVPIDFLVGRCSLETANNILENYSAHFMECRRAAYEKYLANRTPIVDSGKYESPWPYNLLDLVNSSCLRSETTPIDWIVTDSKMQDIYDALDTISEREKNYILMYFRDGMTYRSIGKSQGVCAEVIRQIIMRGIRKLRHPSRSSFLLEKHLSYRELMDLENKLFEEKEAMNERENKLNKKEDEVIKEMQKISIDCLDLSVRTHNCLLRAGMNTLQDVLDTVDKSIDDGRNRFTNIRNLGLKSYQEMLSSLDRVTGESITTKMLSCPFNQRLYPKGVPARRA